MNPLDLALERLQNSRDLTAQRTARYQQSSELQGEYAGFNAASGEMVVRTPSGSAVGVKSVSNGLSQKGEIVAVSLPRGGTAQLSQMPS